jgi:hypothetical protein
MTNPTVTAVRLACLLLCLAGCASQRDKASDASDASVDQSSCAGQTSLTCIIGGCNNDIGTQEVCVNGVLSCPPGSVQCD